MAPLASQSDTPGSGTRSGLIVAIACALFGSGAAGLINQVVWQRSLKVFLGGSETVCSTVVVLVFMGGLGVGSVLMSRYAARLRHPLRTFGRLEFLLSIVNLAVCGLLSSDISDSVFALQRVALGAGVPLLLLYAILATVVLSIPCLLMGATMPLAAEAFQRNLNMRNSRILGLLFFVNTIGSVVGTIVSGGWMISGLGLTASLVVAVVLNSIAGLVLMAAAARFPITMTTGKSGADAAPRPLRPSRCELLGFGLGFCSLAFEMYLFRIFPLRHGPLPFTFAAVLAGFLTFWSLGAAWSARRHGPSISAGLKWCAGACLATLPMFMFVDRFTPIYGMGSLLRFVVLKTPYFLPCLFFGYLFSRVAGEAARSWGQDVGRIYAWNTAGSCLGILATTFIGYEIPYYALLLVLCAFLVAMSVATDKGTAVARRWKRPVLAGLTITVICLVCDVSWLPGGKRLISGRDGVIVIHPNGDVYWDGLWHSQLSHNNNHIGTKNWHLAVMPVIAHADRPIEDVCVIGVGTGITATTLSKLDTVSRVDAYDISSVLDEVYTQYPEGTLGLLQNERIRLIFQDARTGLALNPQKYDLIQAQPLYLLQAGSAFLNSVEFMQLVKRRLKPGGVFCLYSSGTEEQAFAMRETADRVFRFRESFHGGYLLVLSDDPIVIDEATLNEQLGAGDPLWTEIRDHEATSTAADILRLLDRPRFNSGDGQLIVTDDKPIIEYPVYLSDQIENRRVLLPIPTTPPVAGVSTVSP